MHCRREKGRPKTSWNKVIIHDMNFIKLTKDMAEDISLWRSRIKAADHR